MKFGKVLQSTAELFPEKQFLGYKRLKKYLKTLTAKAGSKATNTHSTKTDLPHATDGKLANKGHFVQLLNQELRELNAYFIGEEEAMVIRFQALKSIVESVKAKEKLKCSESLVKFHGDVVSMLHWGILNYAAVAKILKKHDKLLSDHPIRQSYLESVVHQPFYSMEVVERLARESEEMIEELHPAAAVAFSEKGMQQEENTVDSVTESMGDQELACLKKMLYAIRTWRDLGDNAHTPSTVLPYSKPLPETMKMLDQFNNGRTGNTRKRSLAADQEILMPESNKIARATE